MRVHLLLVLIFTISPVFGESIKDLFIQANPNDLEQLSNGEYWEVNSSKSAQPKYLLDHNLFQDLKDYRDEKSPELFLEMVKLIPLEDSFNSKKLLWALNNLSNVSDQEGLQYISFNRGNKLYPLITKSHYTASNNRKSIPDIQFDDFPTNETYTVFQKDTTFGSNIYKYTYTGSESGFRLIITNQGPLSVKGIFKVAAPEEVRISLVFIPVQEGLLCYNLAYIQNPPKVKEVLGYKVNVVGSYTKRLKVIMDWYSNKLLF